MKNHLSMVGSMPAGCRLSCLGTWTAPGSMRSGELWTVTLVLEILAGRILRMGIDLTGPTCPLESCQ
jgi:hypothetical protein